MVKITCDNCGAHMPDRLPPGVEWLLGYDLELEAPNAVQHAIRFLDHWNRAHVLDFGAIQLCSMQCRDEYLARSEKPMKAKAGRAR